MAPEADTPTEGFRVARTASIRAAPAAIFARINDFHLWPDWSPWEGLDPDLSRDYSGPRSGEGAAYAWDGKGKAGAGRMEIIQSYAPSQIVIALSFTRPFKANNRVDFTLTSLGELTEVSWAMTGAQTWFSRLMGKIFNMDKMIGKDFEAGLAKLKALVEA
jgi:hypothetical protein